MPAFSTRTIAKVQQNVNAMLTDRCTLSRKSDATGLRGEPLNATEIIASNVPCRVIRSKVPSDNAQQVIGSQKSMVERYRLICPVGTAFVVDDVVTLADGSVYNVVNVEDQLTDSVQASAVITRVRT